MKRSELYQKVWAKPMTHVAKELGISNVGLAKACRRHDIPVPERGYWAKKAAGHSLVPTPLPSPEKDTELRLTVTAPAQRAQASERKIRQLRATGEMAEKLKNQSSIEMPATLERPHKLVAETARYAAALPAMLERHKRGGSIRTWELPEEKRPVFEKNGRYAFLCATRLDITCSLGHMDWILRFHDVFC